MGGNHGRRKKRVTDFPLRRPRLIIVITALFTIGLAAFIPLIKVDTDPENMLDKDEAVRVFHNLTKDRFNLNDIIALGIVNEEHPDGVFNPDSPAKIYELTEFARALRWPEKEDPNRFTGVIEVDIIAPSLVDHIGQCGPGTIKFEWLMPNHPKPSNRHVKSATKPCPTLCSKTLSSLPTAKPFACIFH